MGDLDRQEAVEQAGGGCVVAVLALALVTAVVALVAYASVATPILAALLLLLGGLGLAVMEWAERG
jgi:hypothetical protein